MSVIQKVKQKIKHSSSFHKANGQKNIFLFSTPRSGSTWLTELICTQTGFKMVKEPFNIRRPEVRENLQLATWDSFFDPLHRPKVEAYINKFIHDEIDDWRYRAPKPFSDLWRVKTHRIIFKLLFIGEHNFEWFGDHFNGHIIFLLRHPIPVALSRKMTPRLDSFIHSPFREHFTQEQMELAERISEKGDKYDCAVLDWCFQNALALRADKDKVMLLSYEQLVMEPEKVINLMAPILDLQRPEVMHDRVNKASRSTNQSDAESQNILNDPQKMEASRRWLIEKWKNKVSPKQVERTFQILRAFDIDYYTEESCLPQDSYLLR